MARSASYMLPYPLDPSECELAATTAAFGRKDETMRTNDNADQLVDLGDAVTETKGQAPFGEVDITSGYRQLMGIEADD